MLAYLSVSGMNIFHFLGFPDIGSTNKLEENLFLLQTKPLGFSIHHKKYLERFLLNSFE